jgi:hypothetical protein
MSQSPQPSPSPQPREWANPTPAGLVALAVACFCFFALLNGFINHTAESNAMPLMAYTPSRSRTRASTSAPSSSGDHRKGFAG